MPLNPVLIARLSQVAQAAAEAPHGGRQAIYQQAMQELQIKSPATLHRYLRQVALRPERKQRSDAGSFALDRQEALIISAALMASHRKTTKRLLSIGQAVEVLRANGEVRAERTDPATGELVPLSDSAIASALRAYGLHPDQLNRPAPAVELQSLHPNHVWQIDASLCVLYYLHTTNPAQAGLQVMDRERFYKNKPAQLKRVEADRVWSYEVTDHNSGAIAVHYVMGAESSANLIESFIHAICQREGDPFHGVPRILMMDQGSANTSGVFSNLARRLQVKVIAHAPGNARATGQVEKARDLIERGFESSLRFRPVSSLAELNAQAQRWVRWFNAARVHSRHGKSRYEQWLTISAEQLRVAPPPEVCRALVSEVPERRTVSPTLGVSYGGTEYDVRSVPGVMVGEKLLIASNPYQADAAVVVLTDSDGNELLHTVPAVQRNDSGFRVDANVIGEDYARAPSTLADQHRAEVDRITYGAASNEEAAAARRAQALPFGGRLDPFKVIEQAPERTFLPRRGTELQPAVTTSLTALPPRVLSLFEAASELARLGTRMDRAKNEQLRAWYPQGVPEAELAALADRLTVRAGLRVVAGGGAS